MAGGIFLIVIFLVVLAEMHFGNLNRIRTEKLNKRNEYLYLQSVNCKNQIVKLQEEVNLIKNMIKPVVHGKLIVPKDEIKKNGRYQLINPGHMHRIKLYGDELEIYLTNSSGKSWSWTYGIEYTKMPSDKYLAALFKLPEKEDTYVIHVHSETGTRSIYVEKINDPVKEFLKKRNGWWECTSCTVKNVVPKEFTVYFDGKCCERYKNGVLERKVLSATLTQKSDYFESSDFISQIIDNKLFVAKPLEIGGPLPTNFLPTDDKNVTVWTRKE